MAIKILMGGSPCTYWSIAQSNNREVEANGMGWELFKNYLIAKERFKPHLFLYENNKSAAQPIKNQIAKELGVGVDDNVRFTYINSALVSAQNRWRFYVTNFGDIVQPEDRGISMEDILSDEDFAPYRGGNFIRIKDNLSEYRCGNWQIGMTSKSNAQGVRVYDLKGKSVTIKAQAGGGGAKTGLYLHNNTVKSLSRYGVEKMQTLPYGYTRAISSDKAISAVGNGWTAEVIIHLLNHALKDVPRDEEIVVLSLYDGIATGRYCLDKMGFTNITYHAYEIDDSPIAVAMDNYPDIIQHGDAFVVRNEGWKPPQTRSEWLDELLGGA